MGTILACCSLLSVVAYVVLIRVGTSRTKGEASEAMLVILGVAVVVHGILGLLCYCAGGHIETLSLLAFMGAGIAGGLLGRRFFLESVIRLGAARADTVKASAPVFSFIWAIAFLNEAPSWYNAVGIMIICSGLVLVSWYSSSSHTTGTPTVRPMSYVFPLLAAFFYSLEPIFVRLGITIGTPFLVGLAVQSLTAAIVYLVYLVATRRFPRTILRSNCLVWYVAAGLASACFMLFLNGALSVAPVIRVFPIVQTSPILVIVVSRIGLRSLEKVSPKLALGALLVVLGAVAVSL